MRRRDEIARSMMRPMVSRYPTSPAGREQAPDRAESSMERCSERRRRLLAHPRMVEMKAIAHATFLSITRLSEVAMA